MPQILVQTSSFGVFPPKSPFFKRLGKKFFKKNNDPLSLVHIKIFWGFSGLEKTIGFPRLGPQTSKYPFPGHFILILPLEQKPKLGTPFFNSFQKAENFCWEIFPDFFQLSRIRNPGLFF